jgi:fumarate hydratase subunit beta
MAEPIRVQTPLTVEAARRLRAGDNVLISGVIYSARDAAHKRMIEALDRGESLPVDMRDQIIYYVGPSPAKPVSLSAPQAQPPAAAWTPILRGCWPKDSAA